MDTQAPPNVIQTGKIMHYLDGKRIEVNGKPIRLSRKEYEVFAFLSESKGLICTEDDLKIGLYGLVGAHKQKTIKVFVAHIRSKIKHAGGENHIETINGAGYRLTDEVQAMPIPFKPQMK